MLHPTLRKTLQSSPTRKWRIFSSLVLISLLVQVLPGRVYAADGDLDPTFGGDGRVTTDFFGGREQARDVAVQPDGRVIAAGFAINPSGGSQADFALARYNIDGSLDPTFGSGGIVTTDFSGDNDFIEAIAIQPDGKIVAAGGATISGSFSAALARYNTDGTLDMTFGSGGKATLSILSQATSLALQADGKIVVSGVSALARLNADGSLDTTFGDGGKVTTDSILKDSVHDVAIQSDGRIVAAGADVVIIGPDPEDPDGTIGRLVLAIARFNAGGSLDTTFGDGGKVITEVAETFSIAREVLIQSDGKIVAVGAANIDFALVRYNLDGSLDATFGNSGIVTTDLGGDSDQAFDAAIQSDGKIVAAGSVIRSATSNDFGLARYEPDGSLDSSFGNGGIVITDFLNNAADIAQGVAVAPDGKIVAAGWTNLGDFPTDTFALARYQVRVATPQNVLQNIITDINGLVQIGALNRGQGNALTATLGAALRQLEAGNAKAAANQINAFINQVNALIKSGRLSPSQGQVLIDQGNEVLGLISG